MFIRSNRIQTTVGVASVCPRRFRTGRFAQCLSPLNLRFNSLFQSSIRTPPPINGVTSNGTIADRVRHFLLNRKKSTDVSSARTAQSTRVFGSQQNLASSVESPMATDRLPCALPRPVTGLRSSAVTASSTSLTTVCLPPIRGDRFTNAAYIPDAAH